MGQQLISFKGAGWRGRTTLTTNDRGDKRLVRIINGYVTPDGAEIRSFPGFRTYVDLTEETNPLGGYARYTYDAVRPVLDTPTPQQFYAEEYQGTDSNLQTLRARARPLWLEAFEQVGETLNIIGISRFREQQIYDASRQPLFPLFVQTTNSGGTEYWTIQCTGNPAANTDTDDTGPGLNGCQVNDVLYFERLTTELNPTLQALLDARLNNRAHKVRSISGDLIVLQTSYTAAVASEALQDGEMHRVRPTRNNTYNGTTGANPWDADYNARIDDLPALTNWRVMATLPLKLSNATSHVCEPAWVANRQRDFGDSNDGVLTLSGWANYAPQSVEGVGHAPGENGVSRREQRELPYRCVPEPAGDRIIIAAPGYNCLFQVPLMVPFDPDGWPKEIAPGSLGIPWFGNDVYDKPRALGIPKCRLIDSYYTSVAPSPSMEGGYSHIVVPIDVSPQYGFPEGTYQLCCTYQDDITGEEGEPSEIITVTVPSGGYGHTLRIHYFHPGYIMPECLAMRLNVYMTAPNGEQLGFYKSFDLKSWRAHPTLGFLGYSYLSGQPMSQLSGKYGFPAATSPGGYREAAEWRSLELPIATRAAESSPGAGDWDLGIDFTRPPVRVGMPRGASAARYIRGTMVAVGHLGIDGPAQNLYQQYGTARIDSGSESLFNRDDLLLTRIHNGNYITNGDGQPTDGFGVAGRSFPDSCQGITAIDKTLLPMGSGRYFQIDKVLNRVVPILSQSDAHIWATWERIKTVLPVFDENYVTSPADPDYAAYRKEAGSYYLRMFQGQVQVGDPGVPWRVVKAGDLGIKNLDANKDQDAVACYQMSGNAIICTRRETFFFSWGRSAGAEIPSLVSREFGCIAPNSMVEFDGGVAWISERGPVAIGASLQFVGNDIQQDFVGNTRRYVVDSSGMMRHCWSCHDSARGIIMWGMLSTEATHSWNSNDGGTVTVEDADDGELSRAPCDEVLIWSYRSNSFSTWRPPSGVEVIWMRQINVRHPDDEERTILAVAFLAADGRIYVLDDTWSDSNNGCYQYPAASKATNSTQLVLDTPAGVTWAADGFLGGGPTGRATSTVVPGAQTFIMRPGQRVEAFNADNEMVWATTIASLDALEQTITLTQAQTWEAGQMIRVGARAPLYIETTFAGGEAVQQIECNAVQVRYTLHGAGIQSGWANAKVQVVKSDLDSDNAPTVVNFTADDQWLNFGATLEDRHGRRRQVQGSAVATEMAVRLEITAEPQVRVNDIALEIV